MNATLILSVVIFKRKERVIFVELSQKAKEVLAQGMIKIRVNRNGMFQQITFRIRAARLGNIEYKELFTDKTIGPTELANIANEIGLPVKAPNCSAFPKGAGVADFQTN